MPRDIDDRVLRVLGEQFGRPDEQVGTENIFDGVEHARMGGQFPGPRKMEVHLPHLNRPRLSAQLSFQVVASRAKTKRFGVVQNSERKNNPLVEILLAL